MGLPSLLSSPRKRMAPPTSVLPEDPYASFAPVSARDRPAQLPDIGSRWLRTKTAQPPASKKGQDQSFLRSFFASAANRKDVQSNDGISSSKVQRYDSAPISPTKDLLISNKLTSQHKMTVNPKETVVTELVSGKLYFAVHENEDHTNSHQLHRPDLVFVTSEIHRRSYGSIERRRGPVHIGAIYRFWEFMNSMSGFRNARGRKLLYYTCENQSKGCAAFLLACYMVLEHKVSPGDAAKSVENAVPSAHHPFEDTDLTLLDCLNAMRMAMEKCWFRTDSFNADEYETLAEPAGGCIFSVGDRFVVFPPPTDANNKSERRWRFSSVFYANMLQRLGCSAVVRVNDAASYDKLPFVERKMKHVDLQFETAPSKTIVKTFLDLCDRQDGTVGVHGSEGSERSCTLICLWMMRHVGFSAREAMAWVRLVRPGVSLCLQEQFLYDAEAGGWNGNWLKSEVLAANEEAEDDDSAEAEVVRWTREPAAGPVQEI